jgi:hypothetical protein
MVRGRLPSPLFRPDCGHPYVASLMIGSGLEKKKLNTGEYKKGVAPNSSRHFKRATLRVRAEREGERRKRALAKKGQQTSESVGSEKKGENEAEAEAEAELGRAKARSRRWAGVPLVAPVWAGCSIAIVRGLPSRSSTHDHLLVLSHLHRLSTSDSTCHRPRTRDDLGRRRTPLPSTTAPAPALVRLCVGRRKEDEPLVPTPAGFKGNPSHPVLPLHLHLTTSS